MNILVTGGTGYLGSHLISKLKNKNKIFVIDKTKNVLKVKNIIKNCTYISAKINKQNINKILKYKKIDLVIHLAGAIKQKNQKKEAYLKDLNSTKNLLIAVRNLNIKYFIYASSCDVYGHNEIKNVKENIQCKPISNYGKNKYRIEKLIKILLEKSYTKYFILRIFNVVGDQIPLNKEIFLKRNNLISNVFKSIVFKKKLNLFGYKCATKDGTCVRDYLEISKFVKIVLSLISNRDKLNSSIFNVGSSIGLSNLEIIHKIQNLLKVKIQFNKKRKRKIDTVYLVSNNEKLRKTLKLKKSFFNTDKILSGYKKYFI